jgi:hypothetical protein
MKFKHLLNIVILVRAKIALTKAGDRAK